MSKYDDIFLSTETIQDFIDKNNIKNKKIYKIDLEVYIIFLGKIREKII